MKRLVSSVVVWWLVACQTDPVLWQQWEYITFAVLAHPKIMYCKCWKLFTGSTSKINVLYGCGGLLEKETTMCLALELMCPVIFILEQWNAWDLRGMWV